VASVVRHRHRARLPTHGTTGFEERFDNAAIGTLSNVASRLCDEAKAKAKTAPPPCFNKA